MGTIFGRLFKYATTTEKLKHVSEEIKNLEERQSYSEHKQRKIVGVLLCYSFLLYILGALLFYFFYFSDTWQQRFLNSLPLIIFPILIYIVKRIVHWYFVKRISANEILLENLKEEKQLLLDEVMEKETYKKATEILNQYGEKKLNSESKSIVLNGENSELRRRSVSLTGVSNNNKAESPASDSNIVDSKLSESANLSPPKLATKEVLNPFRLPLPRPLLPYKRTIPEKMLEFLTGDGPNNRYALICHQCYSHNGMALKDEFPYLSFRCCYCFTFNSAKEKQLTPPSLSEFANISVIQQVDENEAENDSQNETETVIDDNLESTKKEPEDD